MKNNILSKYKQLNTIPIPKRGLILTVIQEELWYIVWEENLLKPKIFNYAFTSEYHATKFATTYLDTYRYNILPGLTLIKYDFEVTDVNISKATGEKQSKSPPNKYCLHPDLPKQRKKTLRNLYRRNQRRLLLKLLSMQNPK